MKKFIYYLFLSVAMVATFTACSDDDDPYFTLPQTLQGKNVTIISNGNNLSGIQCNYSLSNDGKTVTLDLYGTAASKADAPAVPAIQPGYILPGAAQVTLTFEPKIGTNDAIYEGQGTSTYCTYTYRVTFTEAAVSVEFKDIVMNSGLLLSEVTYTDSDVDHLLELTYNGAPLIGKTVKYTPNTTQLDKATLTLAGATLDLTEMLATIAPSLQGLDLSKLSTIPTAGVFPGSVTNNLEITVGENGAFSGQGETEFLTFKYSGTATASKMALNITEATLKNTAIAGTYDVPVQIYNEDTWEYEGNPIKFEWESSEVFNIEFVPGSNLPMPPATIVSIMLQMPLISVDEVDENGDPINAVPIHTMLSRALKTITFQPDGNVIAEYVPKADIATPAVKSPANIAQYVVAADGKILLFLNPQAILMNVMQQGSKSSAEGGLNPAQFQGIVDGLVPVVLNLVQNGVPVAYAADGNNLSVYLDTEFLKPLLLAICPVFNNQEFIAAVIKLAGKNEDFASMAPMLGGILKDFPKVVEGTTKLEIGLNLVKGAQ